MRHSRYDKSCPLPAVLVAYAGAEPLALGTRQRLVAHLACCQRCQKRVAAMRAVLRRDLVVEVAEAYKDVTSAEELLD
jgi:anti-sigma factor ChrR (cupin superfamily)